MPRQTPDLVHLEGLGRLAIGLRYGEYGGGDVHAYVFSRDDELEVGALYYNSWDGEVFEVTDISEPCQHCDTQTVTAQVINAGNERIEREREWFEPDHERIHRLEKLSDVIEWTD